VPDVSDLITQISEDTGLEDSGTEAAQIVRALNRAYRRIVTEFACNKYALAIAGDGTTTSWVLGSQDPDIIGIDTVHLYDGTTYTLLPQLRKESVGQQGGNPMGYVVEQSGSSFTLWVDRAVPDGYSLQIRYFQRPAELTSASLEADILGIDAVFHEDLLATLATAYILEGAEGEEERASYYRQLHAETKQVFVNFLVERGGFNLPNDRAFAPHFTTPAPLEGR
jgi:hypothetical protein